jgi:cytochrome P450/NADPH-cytochrome P450 reductase
MTAIPMPPELPILGHLHIFATDNMIERFDELSLRAPRGIFALKTPYGRLISVHTAALAKELLDETRFSKAVIGPLQNVRAFSGDGLFTAYGWEPNWGKAHRILTPGFTAPSMKTFFPDMLTVAKQLVAHWERAAARDEWVVVAEDTTRLTLDTIALCGFGYAFESFRRPELHPFLRAMTRALFESGATSRRPPLLHKLALHKHREFADDITTMNELVDRVIRERHEQPPEEAAKARDFLSLMLGAKDKVTGEPLDDVNIRYQVLTFLIAGHETTSGLLAFTLHYLLRNPDVLARARAEVDAICGAREPTLADVSALTWLHAILFESLRLWPSAPAFAVASERDETVGGFEVAAGEPIMVFLPRLHRDPAVYDRPEEFLPSRFEGDAAKAIPTWAYRPFGNGKRACIGRQFALVEAKLALALIVRDFELEGEPGYALRVRDTLSVKPDGFRVKVRRRPPNGVTS